MLPKDLRDAGIALRESRALPENTCGLSALVSWWGLQVGFFPNCLKNRLPGNVRACRYILELILKVTQLPNEHYAFAIGIVKVVPPEAIPDGWCYRPDSLGASLLLRHPEQIGLDPKNVR